MHRLKPKYPIELTPEQVRELTKTTHTYTSLYCEAQRAEILIPADANHFSQV